MASHPAKQQKREDKRLRKETERRRNEAPDKRKNRLLHYNVALPFDRFSEIYTFTLLGEETVAGRSAWVIDGVPKPGFRPQTDAEKEAANFHVKIWVDQDEAHPQALELTVTGGHSRLQKGTRARSEWTRLNDGTWMLKQTLPGAFAFSGLLPCAAQPKTLTLTFSGSRWTRSW